MDALRVTYAIWLRELKLFVREPTRLIGMVGQPLLYLLIVAQGIASGMTLNEAPPRVNYLLFIYPGIIGMSVLFTSMFSAISIIWDREFGFLKEVLVSPAPRWAVALGKILGGATVATLQAVILLGLSPVAGVIPSPTMVLGVLLLCFLLSCALTGLGVAIAANMRSMQGFQMISNFLIMPMYFLSGAMFQLKTAPAWMRPLMRVDPLTYGVAAMRGVVWSGVGIEGEASELSLAANVGVLALCALVLAAVAAVRFSRAD